MLLYGAAPGREGEIAVVVRGPARDTTVRRKSRVGPIWINTSALEFQDVPSFYAVAASVPLDELGGAGTLARHELGAERLRLTPIDADGLGPRTRSPPSARHWCATSSASGCSPPSPAPSASWATPCSAPGSCFPANVPPGDYQVQVLQFADGEVVGAQTSKLEIAKMGIEAELFDFALGQPALYGLASILIALTAGWARQRPVPQAMSP